MNMKVLIACEESQVVCKAFREKGHEAFSCDIQDCSGERPEWHFKEDVLKVISRCQWDMMIAFPPCTYLTYAATRHWNLPGRDKQREEGMKFFMEMINAPIKKIAVENPQGWPNTVYRKPDQIIHPWYFGDNDKKRTCLWLKNLPKLTWAKEENLFFPVTAAPEPEPLYINKSGKRIFFSEGCVGRSKNKAEVAIIRSKTFPGIAQAMADQWGR
jgi:hypothetical protein